jgi:hypothetical protein
MSIPSLTASQALLDLVLDAQQCTDYRAAPLLGVQKSAVSRWRTGRGHMGNATVERACELAKCPELAWYFIIIISAEREKGPDGDCFRTVAATIKTELEGKPRTQTTEKVVHALAARALKRKVGAASAVIIGLFLGFASAGAGLQASPEIVQPDSLYIMRTSRRRRKAA